jgi:Homeodomain-like domain
MADIDAVRQQPGGVRVSRDPDLLTARILELRDQGRTYDQIAGELGIGRRTVGRALGPAAGTSSCARSTQAKSTP